ncbi:SDR family NAD(P)-dependent oxidoreductase [Saccharopolyspora spinosa]|uniref:SDR family NAD(P)-dependent oxidoreductase n=1 Tax=Saccharopolyspora spinosa TaxID=60894 RepID=UPI000237A57F|nr:3-oxoacyl-ACP reductase family protein [Saccharopolyspora spinosa]
MLDGRTALVVGAAGGIGRSIALTYARVGASLMLGDRHSPRLAETVELCERAGAKTHSTTVDVTDPASTQALIDDTVKSLGSLHILVNSAGVITEVPVSDMTVEQWDETLDVDLKGVFLCCRWAVPHMLEQRWGRIINIASQVGQKGGIGFAHYTAAKAGVIGFTKALAREVAGNGVLVNAIAPGPIETDFVAGLAADTLAAKQRELPLGRAGLPDEVAPTALLLASEPGGNLYVGQTLGPNSGDVMP